MARPLRPPIPGARFHVFCRGVDGVMVFRDDADRHKWTRLLSKVALDLGIRVLAWSQLGTHYHLLVEDPEGNLSVAMQRLNGEYAQWFNRRHGRRGHLWADRFGSVLVETSFQLAAAIRYVTLNPVKAGLASTPAEWKWSSHRAAIGLDPPLVPDGGLMALLAPVLVVARRLYAALISSREDDGTFGPAAPAAPGPATPAAELKRRRRGRARRPRGRGG